MAETIESSAFISYASADASIANSIVEVLERTGIRCWIAPRDVVPGSLYADGIVRAINETQFFVLVLSGPALASKHVGKELERASSKGHPIFAIRTDTAALTPAFEYFLNESQWIDAGQGGLEAAVGKLVAAMRNQAPPSPAVSDSTRVLPKARRWPVLGGIAALVALGGVALLLVVQPHLNTRPVPGSGDGRIEIGAFEAVTKTQDLEHFGKRVADSVVRVLVTNDVKAVARVEAHSDGAARSTAEFTLRGNVDRDGENYVVNTDLLHNREGLVLWSTTMQRNAGEPQLLEQRFATSIARVMRCALALRLSANDDASVDLVGNLFQFCAATDDLRLEQFPVIAQKIVEAAPSDALSYSLRAYANAMVSTTTAVYFTDRTAEERARLRTLTYDSAKTALEMDSNGLTAGLAYFARAVVIDPAVGLVEREQLFQKAVSLQFWPAYYSYANFLGDVGRIEDARNYLMRGVNLEPLQSDLFASNAAYLAAALGYLSAARDQFKEVKAKGGYASDSDVPSWFDMERDYGDPAIAKQMLAQNKQLGRNLLDPTQDASACLNAFLDFRSGHVQLNEDQVRAACSSGFHAPPPVVIGSFGLVDWEFREFEDWNSPDFYALYPSFATQYFLPNFRSVRADPRFMPFAEKIGRVDYWLDSGHWPDFCKEEKLPYDCKEAALAARANAAR